MVDSIRFDKKIIKVTFGKKVNIYKFGVEF